MNRVISAMDRLTFIVIVLTNAIAITNTATTVVATTPARAPIAPLSAEAIDVVPAVIEPDTDEVADDAVGSPVPSPLFPLLPSVPPVSSELLGRVFSAELESSGAERSHSSICVEESSETERGSSFENDIFFSLSKFSSDTPSGFVIL